MMEIKGKINTAICYNRNAGAEMNYIESGSNTCGLQEAVLNHNCAMFSYEGKM